MRLRVKRIKKKGRVRGGMLLAIRKEIEIVGQEREEERENGEKETLTKTIKIEGKKIRTISTYMGVRRRENWSCIEEEAEKYKGISIIVGGDFTRRTAQEEGKLSEQNTYRASKDKIKNREGEEMLEKIREIGMHIINGGTMDKGDGEFTYVGGGGKSTIDHVVTNEGDEIIEEMEVGTNTESDHQPLIVKIYKKYSRQAKRQKEATMDWSENAVIEFQKKLSKKVKNEDWTEIKGKIQNAIQWREIRRDGKKKEKWWDRICHERKIQLKEKLRRCKSGNLEVEEYRKERKAYRNWIEKKKSEWNEKILEDIEKDKIEKNFWKVVNVGRKERIQIFEGIEEERWLEHFKKQLEGTDL